MKIAIVDYGMGNLFSVRRAAEVCGGENVILARNAEDFADADRLILPGVGGFKDGMLGLRAANLVEPLQEYAASGRPMLGICLGAQMLAETGEEFGQHEGLAIIPGNVTRIPIETKPALKLPFVGWSPLEAAQPGGFDGSPLAGLGPDDAVYLVHSFYINPTHSSHLLATYDYDGLSVTAAVRKNNVIGLQFHPEKSGEVGLQILHNFFDQA